MFASHIYCGTWMLQACEMCFMTWNKLQTHMCDTHFQGIIDIIYYFWRLFMLQHVFYPSSSLPVLFLSIYSGFTHPTDGWTCLCIKLWYIQLYFKMSRCHIMLREVNITHVNNLPCDLSVN